MFELRQRATYVRLVPDRCIAAVQAVSYVMLPIPRRFRTLISPNESIRLAHESAKDFASIFRIRLAR